MFNNATLIGMLAFALVFLITMGVGFVVFLRAYGDQRRAISRLRSLAAGSGPAVDVPAPAGRWGVGNLPLIGSYFLPRTEGSLEQLATQMLKAGIFDRRAPQVYLTVKWLLMILLPLVGAAVPWFLRVLPANHVPLAALTGCVLGMWAPSFWLRTAVSRRQGLLRSALPDLLDMLVLCLEGGLGLMAAIQRVTDELHVVHPELAGEMNLLQREIQLGLSAGQALKKFATRSGLEEARDLAATVLQSEQFGASVAKTFRVYADTYRVQRQQRAEELAQKASVKILFPMLLLIFPAIFIVVLGPAAIHISRMFAR